MLPFTDEISRLEKEAAAGNSSRVAKALANQSTGNLSLAQAVRAASLARTVGAIDWGLRALTPMMWSPTGKITGNEDLLTLYCGLLVKAGAAEEALRLLGTVKNELNTSATLYRVHALVGQWRYGETIPHLHRYLELVQADARQQIIGELNLAAAFIHEGRSLEAHEVLAKLLPRCREFKNPVFLGNAYEIRAQLSLLDRQWQQTLTWLNKSVESHPSAAARQELFIAKWRAVAVLAQSPHAPASREPLNKLRLDAIQMNHWETVRDCDRLLAVHTGDPTLALKLYFGTPYEAYRAHLMRELKQPLEIPSDYPLVFTGSGRHKELSLLMEKRSLWFQLSPLSARLFAALACDTYRGRSVPELFYRLHPDESFNVFNSAVRIRVAINQVRKAVKPLGFTVVCREGLYSLQSNAALVLHVPKNLESLAASGHRVAFLNAQGADLSRPDQVAAALGVSVRTARRVLGR